MKQFISIWVVLLLSAFYLSAQGNDEASYSKVHELSGDWIIELQPRPEAESYQKEMHIQVQEDRSIHGEFYDSDISESVINANGDKLYFAFTTGDQNNLYYHSGYLKDGTLYGTTYCPSREFMTPWIGRRIE